MNNYFTKEGLEFKLKQIKAQEKKVQETGSEAGKEAGANCDWHDNFGYEDAKRRLEMESTTLKKLKDEVSGAVLINIHEQNDHVMIGVTVKVLMNGEEKEFTIGAFGETDPPNGLIAYNSPLARALMQMEEGDTKKNQIGGKVMDIELVKILPPSYRYYHLIKKQWRTLVSG